MLRKASQSDAASEVPQIWDFTDYRVWFTETFKARKALHSWYSYGVLAQRAGFKARDFLMRVMKGQKSLSRDGAVRLSLALDLTRREQEYFLALVEYNQATDEQQRCLAWERVQGAMQRGKTAAPPKPLTRSHGDVVASMPCVALRTLLELRPDAGRPAALGSRLRPARTAKTVHKALEALQEAGLVERRADGLLHAADRSLVANAEVGVGAIRQFHRESLRLAERSLEEIPVDERNITGVTLSISRRTYDIMCQRLAEIHLEFGRLAELDEAADRVYHLTLAMFPVTHPLRPEDAS